MERYASIDIIRGLAIFSMVGVHMAVSLFFDMSFMTGLGVLVTPLFLMVAGTSCELFSARRQLNTYKLELLSRALILYIFSIAGLFFGHLFLPKIYPVFEFFSLGLIQLIALGYVFSIILPLNLKFKVLLIIIVFIIAFILKVYFSHLPSSFLPTYSRLFYIVYFWFGQIVYAFLYSNHKLLTINTTRNNMYNYLSIILVSYISIYFIYLHIFLNNFNDLLIFLLTSGFYILLAVFLIFYIDLGKRKVGILNLFEMPGKIAFTIYYIHMPLIFFFVLPLYKFFSFNRSTIMSIATIFLLFLIFAVIEIRWRKRKYIMGAEWILREGAELVRRFIIIMKHSKFKD